MKFFTLISLPMLVFLTMVQSAGATNADNKTRAKVIVIDKEKQFPEKELNLKARETFIRLETKKGVSFRTGCSYLPCFG